MPYEGELMTSCPAKMFDFSKAYAVIVSGAKFNPYGHMLLNTGGRGGVYFQVAGLYARPRLMNEGQFQRYLKENNKFVVTAIKVMIPNPQRSEMKLEQLLAEKWKWGVVVHNCEEMVQEIIEAGGGRRISKSLLSLPMKATNVCTPW